MQRHLSIDAREAPAHHIFKQEQDVWRMEYETREVIMSTYRDNLTQLGSTTFLTDGGLETTLVFHHHPDLPEFAAFPLLEGNSQKQRLWDYYLPYIELARERRVGFILESPTWRASKDWAVKTGSNRGGSLQIQP